MDAQPGPVERDWVDRCGVVDRLKDPQAAAAVAARQQAAFEWTTEQYKQSSAASLQRHFAPTAESVQHGAAEN
jgi:hypothetical protein